MLPVFLDLTKVKIALIGNGDIALKRLLKLEKAGGKGRVDLYSSNPSDELQSHAASFIVTKLPNYDELKKYNIVMIADLDEEERVAIANMARELNIIVNMEDKKPYCDFFFSSYFNRGDLSIAVNSGGNSPQLAVRIRKYLENKFGHIWEARLDDLAKKRESWKNDGAEYKEIIAKTNDYIDEKGWLN